MKKIERFTKRVAFDGQEGSCLNEDTGMPSGVNEYAKERFQLSTR